MQQEATIVAIVEKVFNRNWHKAAEYFGCSKPALDMWRYRGLPKARRNTLINAKPWLFEEHGGKLWFKDQ